MIRRATMFDLNAIMDIVDRCKQQMKVQGNEQWNEAYPLHHHYEGDISSGTLFVSENSGYITGVACISEKAHEDYDNIKWQRNNVPYLCVKRLAVDPNYRSSGIGAAFYSFAEQLAHMKGIELIRTDTYAKNKAALKLFQKAGYTYIDSLHLGDYESPFYYYEKILS
ncbi:GNAT family N-acetyltransferase [Salirhabdus salicampi]|uniref:GNAT family N-acetyltransferase n=1 Tax=Salirhabdus salicampi TaxID=476102 RepID=UPI0020C3E39A|nr:GNAT family N-acetyltransferase [Salirhabdus salicampi]MCP8618106.1 GNAT family N-acetyltransferase [Salirhabdus salicampi]